MCKRNVNSKYNVIRYIILNDITITTSFTLIALLQNKLSPITLDTRF